MDPSFVAKTAQIASVLEVSGYPKPGNVHRTHDFDDMFFEDFLISGVVIGDTMKEAAEMGLKYQKSLQKIEIGRLIKKAVCQTNEWIANNTNLGIVMLSTPLAAAAGMSNDLTQVKINVSRIMNATTSQDAVNLYDAINIADAGGMGEREDLDVGSDTARKELLEKDINMFHVLDISAGWDMISYELTNRMPISFNTGFPVFKRIKPVYGINRATVQTFLTILSMYPDTLISRKYGKRRAEDVSEEAKTLLDEGGILGDEGFGRITRFDKKLVKNRLNPGTTADLTASSIMIALLDEFGSSG